MISQSKKEYISVYRDGLLNDTLPFWLNHAVDKEHGGYITSLNRDGSVLDTDKCMWQQGRFAWLLGHLYNNVETKNEWLESAKSGLDFITEHGHDSDGQLFFHVTQDGKPIRKRRYVYSESFAAIAFAEYAKATGENKYAERAIEYYETFLKYNSTPGLIQSKYTNVRSVKSVGFPMISIVTAQVLRNTIDYPEATACMNRAIDEIKSDFFKPDIQAVMESVGSNGEILNHFDGRTLNPGHAIEASWFLMHEAKYRNDDELLKIGTQMLDFMWERGWDKEYGGIFYFRDLNNLPVQEYWHDMKFWWPHNETIIATLLAYELTGNQKYVDWHKQVHNWAYKHFPDPEHGEWFGYLHRDGSISSTLKGNMWKGPFHLPRMQLYCWKLLESSVKTKNSSERVQ